MHNLVTANQEQPPTKTFWPATSTSTTTPSTTTSMWQQQPTARKKKKKIKPPPNPEQIDDEDRQWRWRSSMKMKIRMKMKIGDKPQHHQPCWNCSSSPNGHDPYSKFRLLIHLCQFWVLEWPSRIGTEPIVWEFESLRKFESLMI